MKKISLSRWQVILGVLTLIATIAVPIFLFQPASSKVNAAERFISDLERIKVIAPKNVDLEMCLSAEMTESFDQKYEDCFNKIKQNQNEARSLLERNKSSIETFYGSAFLARIEDNLINLDYLLYEMGNNQYLLQHWKEDGCPDKVDFIAPEELTMEKVMEGPDGSVKCALAIQTQEAFLRRQNSDCNQDCLSALKKSLIPTEDTTYMVVPGSSQSVSKYFLQMNNNLYSYMLGEIDDLLTKLREQL